MNPELALKIVGDKHFMMSMATITDETIIKEQIENKFVKISAELQQAKGNLENEKESLVSALKLLETKIGNIEAENEERKKQIAATMAEIRAKEQKLGEYEDNIRQYKAFLASNSLESNSLKTELETKNKKYNSTVQVYKWIVFCIILGFLSLFIWRYDHFLSWDWLKVHPKVLFIQIVSQLTVIFASLSIPARKHWIVWLSFSVTLIVALIMILATKQ
jgi:hypothetical protein